jgi:hypothetical protein
MASLLYLLPPFFVLPHIVILSFLFVFIPVSVPMYVISLFIFLFQYSLFSILPSF